MRKKSYGVEEVTILVDAEFRNEAVIRVVGVGGGGNNAVDRMIVEGGMDSLQFIAANTDKMDLDASGAVIKIQLGGKITRGLGAGNKPAVGRAAAEESTNEIKQAINGTDLLFITAGMGGGTGTGAAPIIASIAKDLGILTVGVVTKPFDFEGRPRMRNAVEGISELRKYVDTLIVIPNEKLLESIEENTPIEEAFMKADEVLLQGVKSISDLISKPGSITLDFADVKTIMSGKGIAHMGVGRGKGKKKAEEAARAAVGSPLLETSIDGARAMLISISGNKKLSLTDIKHSMELIKNMADEEAEIIFGHSVNEDLDDEMVITVVATGLDSSEHDGDYNRSSSTQSKFTPPPVESTPRFSQGMEEGYLSQPRDLGQPRQATSDRVRPPMPRTEPIKELSIYNDDLDRDRDRDRDKGIKINNLGKDINLRSILPWEKDNKNKNRY